jgi:4-carboxymuconolactone decarboxylase
MARLAPPDPAALSPLQKEVYDAIAASPRGGVRGPLALWLHRPQFAGPAQTLGAYCRYNTSLPPRLTELAILVTARVWGAEYEWQAHKKFALEAGISPEAVEAIRTHQTPAFADAEAKTVYEFALALQKDRHVPQPLYDRAVAALGEPGVVDLVGALGYYALVAMTITVFDIDPQGPRELG